MSIALQSVTSQQTVDITFDVASTSDHSLTHSQKNSDSVTDLWRPHEEQLDNHCAKLSIF